MSEFENTIKKLRHHIEEEKKCYETLIALPSNGCADAETKRMMKQLCLGKSYELACLDQLLAVESA